MGERIERISVIEYAGRWQIMQSEVGHIYLLNRYTGYRFDPSVIMFGKTWEIYWGEASDIIPKRVQAKAKKIIRQNILET